MASPQPTPDTETTVLFRPNKRRKNYRQRASPSSDTETSLPPAAIQTAPQSLDELIASSSLSPNEADDVESTTVPISEILRLRKLRKPKIGGVEFRAENAIRDGDGELVLRDEGGEGEEERKVDVVRRFAPQTGMVGDVNRHMMAFIESQLDKQRAEGLAHSEMQIQQRKEAESRNEGGVKSSKGDRGAEAERQPATLGKLLEIDLGVEARDRNVERTDLARRRLDGEEVDEEMVGKGKGKVRLGRDGKPWRGRKRRGSDDVKRDKMVEDVLRENRLEIYDEIPVEETTINDDQAADDRIAEAFRREFMDAVSQRQRKKTAPVQPPSRTVGGKKEEELKGPKLGGSRSARAAMRETMLKSGKK